MMNHSLTFPFWKSLLIVVVDKLSSILKEVDLYLNPFQSKFRPGYGATLFALLDDPCQYLEMQYIGLSPCHFKLLSSF